METQTKRPNNMIWGAVLIGLGALFLSNQFFGFLTGFIWSTALAGIGLVFYYVSKQQPQNWWALIPSYIFFFVAGIITISSMRFIPGEFIGSFIMFGVGFPFLYVYMRDHEHWWALIPAYIMAAIGVFIPLTIVLPGSAEGAYVMFAVAAPFLYVYFRNRNHWWALIPGGIMGMVGAGLLIGALLPLLPALMIAAGVYLLVRQMGDKKEQDVAITEKQQIPPSEDYVNEFEPLRTGSEVDRPLK